MHFLGISDVLLGRAQFGDTRHDLAQLLVPPHRLGIQGAVLDEFRVGELLLDVGKFSFKLIVQFAHRSKLLAARHASDVGTAQRAISLGHRPITACKPDQRCGQSLGCDRRNTHCMVRLASTNGARRAGLDHIASPSSDHPWESRCSGPNSREALGP